MMRVLGATLLAGLGLLAACSGKAVDEGEGGAGSGDEPSPAEKCRIYADTWCNKAFGCYVEVGRLDEASRQSNVDSCIQLIEERLPCSAVASTSGGYDKCISQIKGLACSRWNVPQTQFANVAPPASCELVFEF